MQFARVCGFRVARAGRPLVIALLLSGLALATDRIADAIAQPRFGDTTWTAPPELFAADTLANGPRVAAPDRERGWETALRAPFRIAFFPVRLFARGLEEAAAFYGPRVAAPDVAAAPRRGKLKIVPRALIGDIDDFSVGAGLVWNHFPAIDARFDASATYSLNDRRRARVRQDFGVRRTLGLRLQGDHDYKPNRKFYGIGNDSRPENETYFKLSASGADASLLLGSSPARQLRLIGGISTISPGRGYYGDPLMEHVFALDTIPFARRTAQEVSFGVGADWAKLDDGANPSRGVHGRFEARRAVGLRSVDPDYYRWRTEGRAYVPLGSSRRVVALRGVYSGVQPDDGVTMPFYRLAESRGSTHFVGFPSGRFRDHQLMLGRVEYRWNVLRGLSAVALYEIGEVSPNLRSFRLRDAHDAVGGGLRYGFGETSAARLEFADGGEGLQVVFNLGSDF